MRRPPSVPLIDFQRAQPQLQRTVPWLGWGLLVAAFLLLGGIGGAYMTWLDRYRAAEATQQQFRMRTAAQRPLTESQLAEARFASQALAIGRADWEGLFGAVERASTQDIVLVSMHPQAASGEVRLGGEADTAEAISRYMASLAQQPGLTDVRLLGHQPQLRAERAAVRFDIVARWGG